MELLNWLETTESGKFLFTLLVSMVPVVELRGGIPFGVAMGLSVPKAYLAAVIGNMLPVPFIIVYIRRIFQWMRRHMPKLNSMVDKLEKKAHEKGREIARYEILGLFLFVAIPLPGTGAWTGSLAAAFLDMRLKKAIPTIAAGVLTAGVLISILTFGVASIF